jgi:hypothetical protein
MCGVLLMPRVCTICTHPARAAIDDGLEAGQSLRAVAGQYSLSKSSLDRHKAGHIPNHRAQEGADLKAEFRAARQADRWQYNQLRKHARAAVKAFEGWGSIRSPEEWQTACEDARKRYQSGCFLIERLGAERFLDPQLMATLWQLRQGLLEEYGAESPAMAMAIHAVMMSYYNLLKIQGWIGDLALVIEQELFAEDPLKVKLRQQYGVQFDGFAVEEHLQRIKEELFPLSERAYRQLLSNLQALRQGRPGVLPAVAIGRAGQVNVAQQQVNLQQKDGRASQPVAPR